MCGRFYLNTDSQTLTEHFDASCAYSLVPHYNIAPSQEVIVVRQGSEIREIVMLRWGLIPFWAKSEKTGYKMINARAETVASKPAYRAAFRQRRCILPASGFYEWKTTDNGKQPYCIRTNDDLMAFAGLWEHWQGEGGDSVESCTIIVTEANDKLRPIHDRMPVILDPVDYEVWLDPEMQDPDVLKPMLRSYPEEMVTFYPVSRKVGNPSYDNPDCIEPLTTELKPRGI